MAGAGGTMRGDDQQLVSRSEADTPAAFVELYRRHGGSVHAYLARRTGRQDADDLLGEVWLRAFRGRATYDHRCHDARPWLYGIARHVLLAHWRQGERSPAAFADPPPSDPWDDVDTRVDAEAERGRLQKALRTLSPDEREVLLLVIWEHLTPSEVAVALNIPQGTARSRLHRARSIVRREFDAGSYVTVRSHPEEA
jgi:RNA polymerase sigma-70 factor (ECF subfamily)